jgi:hypothetical protein
MTRYRIRGLDGREYGPVDVETAARWAREGRIISSMSVQAEGSADWMPAGAVPEIAAAIAGGPASIPAVSPAAALPVGAPDASSSSSGSYSGASGGAASNATNTGSIYGPGSVVSSDAPAENLRPSPDANLAVGFVFGRAFELFDWVLLGQVLVVHFLSAVSFGLILAGPLHLGLMYCCLKKVDGEPFEFGDIFKGFDNFGHALLAYLLVAIAGSAGFACCILPGIFLLVKFWYWPFAMAERPGRNAIDALTDSWHLTNGRFFDFLALGFVAIFCWIAGLLMLCVGIFPATVIVFLASAVAYRQLVPKGRARAQSMQAAA